MGSTVKICAICGKDVMERTRFHIVLEQRKKYRTYWEPIPIDLYFHVDCITKVNVNVKNLYDLLRVMNKLGA